MLNPLGQTARPQDAWLGRVSGSPALHNVGDDEAAQAAPALVVFANIHSGADLAAAVRRAILVEPEDRALAEISDSQGGGGRATRR